MHAEHQKALEEKNQERYSRSKRQRSFCLSVVVLGRLQCFYNKYVCAKCLKINLYRFVIGD